MDAYGEVAELLQMSEMSVRRAVREFEDSGDAAPDNRGKHSKARVQPLTDPEARDEWEMYAREQSQPRGGQNLICEKMLQYWELTLSRSIRRRISDEEEAVCAILTLEDVPYKISVSTARRSLIATDFTQDRNKKGCYVDGHERLDVQVSRKKYCDFMKKVRQRSYIIDPTTLDVSLPDGFISSKERPTTEEKNLYEILAQDTLLIALVHDESSFSANDDERSAWVQKGRVALRPKARGKGVMISDFIEVKGGWLELTDDEHKQHPNLPKNAQVTYDNSKDDGYWDNNKFME